MYAKPWESPVLCPSSKKNCVLSLKTPLSRFIRNTAETIECIVHEEKQIGTDRHVKQPRHPTGTHCCVVASTHIVASSPSILRIHDLHSGMLKKLAACKCGDLENPREHYIRHFNPMLATSRYGEINYLERDGRKKPLSKRTVPPRTHKLK
ncbi:hypothetical protein EVAR_51571_1 [Eumeta japonica]|uniref:Uncharacterized protein n=1 Tax=Eumeta variegata TaxID=151549 RepID=A0A4C1Z7B9_EUMVA|nr:hypothetical protein EVAR_51571_1 [Eumeta japonica]